MLFAKIENNVVTQWPIQEKQLRKLVADRSLPKVITQEALAGTNFVIVHTIPAPADLIETMDKKLVLGDLIQQDGNWVRTYSLVTMMPIDRTRRLDAKWRQVRTIRNDLIEQASKRVERYHREIRLGLTPKDDLTVLDTYIQALADITKTEDPFLITFPTPV